MQMTKVIYCTVLVVLQVHAIRRFRDLLVTAFLLQQDTCILCLMVNASGT
jgi:hypothetical protein